VSIETKTGRIVAMVGGNDYDTSKFNLASQGRRQPGSAFKPFVLTAAIEMGIDPWTTYYLSAHVSLTYPGASKPWDVQTYGRDYYGPSTLVEATLRSDNTVYAQLALDVGSRPDHRRRHRMGITSELNATPAIALGGLTYGVSPLEMAAAYATLGNGGVHIEPTIIQRIRDANGKRHLGSAAKDQPGSIGRRGLRRSPAFWAATSRAAQARGQRSADPPPARQEPPRTGPTRGSSAIRPTSRRRCGWVIPTPRCP